MATTAGGDVRAVELAEAKDATIKELRVIVEDQEFDIDVRLHAAQILLSVQDLG